MCTWAGFQHFNYDRKKTHALPKKGVIVQTFLKGSSEKKTKQNFSVIITKALKVVPTMGMSNRQIYTLILLVVFFLRIIKKKKIIYLIHKSGNMGISDVVIIIKYI